MRSVSTVLLVALVATIFVGCSVPYQSRREISPVGIVNAGSERIPNASDSGGRQPTGTRITQYRKGSPSALDIMSESLFVMASFHQFEAQTRRENAVTDIALQRAKTVYGDDSGKVTRGLVRLALVNNTPRGIWVNNDDFICPKQVLVVDGQPTGELVIQIKFTNGNVRGSKIIGSVVRRYKIEPNFFLPKSVLGQEGLFDQIINIDPITSEEQPYGAAQSASDPENWISRDNNGRPVFDMYH